MRVTVISRLHMAVKMHMPRAVMVVLMQVPALSKQLRAEQTPKRDEHESDHTFRRVCDRLRNRDAQEKDDGSDKQQHRGVTEPPTQTNETRRPP
jgi:hypothetical protein